MTTIDRTYFWGKIKLDIPEANLGVSPALTTSTSNDLAQYTGRYQDEYLHLLLGSQYDSYCAAPTSEEWAGLDALLFDTSNKLSPIANYIFCQYWSDKDTLVSTAGTTKGIKKDSVTVSNKVKTDWAWNEMIVWTMEAIQWLIDNDKRPEDEITWDTFIHLDSGVGRFENMFGI